MSLLSIRDLRVSFHREERWVPAVDGLYLDVDAGEVSCLVGESGCGKTVTALSLTRLIPEGQSRVDSGEIWFEGEDILKLPPEALRRVRGRKISYIFQEPGTSLNPVFTIGSQLMESLQIHRGLDFRSAREAAIGLLGDVEIRDPEARLRAYPHELSGGMKQRVMIAMAIAPEPVLLVADEPTTSLDVTIQTEILSLLKRLQSTRRLAVLFITHDFSIVSQIATHVAVMYLGRIVEVGPVASLLGYPCHPYTIGLLNCIPTRGHPKEPLRSIPGRVPDISDVVGGCRFHPRCPWKSWECVEQEPPMVDVGPGHAARCVRIPIVLQELGRGTS